MHGHTDSTPSSNRVRGVLALMMLPLISLTVVAIVALWPSQRTFTTPALGPDTELVNGTVGNVDLVPCNGDPASGTCMNVSALVTEGPDRGEVIRLSLPRGPGQVDLFERDKIVLGRSVDPTGQVAYYFSDYQRAEGLILIAGVFAALVVLVARWRGIGALAGLGVTFFVVTGFMLPSILEGNSPVLVALAGGSVIVLTVLYVAHGLNARTTTALIGTLVSMVITGALAVLAVDLTNITGLASEETTYVQNFAGQIDIRGLLLGGIILGALGVLNDVTITQASAVWEVHRAQPFQSRLELYRSGMRVGRDHIASTVYTLVLAYTGASLPLLILFILANRPFGDVATSSIVGEELVRTLVGSIGLILCVPITTALAAAVAKGDADRKPATDPSDQETTATSADGATTGEPPTEEEAAQTRPEKSEAGDVKLETPTELYDHAQDDRSHELQPGAPVGESLPHSGDDTLGRDTSNQTASISTVPPPLIDPETFAPRPIVTDKSKRRWWGLRPAKGADYFEARKISRKERKFWKED